jgi:hypothetical protein
MIHDSFIGVVLPYAAFFGTPRCRGADHCSRSPERYCRSPARESTMVKSMFSAHSDDDLAGMGVAVRSEGNGHDVKYMEVVRRAE